MFRQLDSCLPFSTGIAALQIGGTTLLNFAVCFKTKMYDYFKGVGLAEGPVEQLVNTVKKNRNAKRRWKGTKVDLYPEKNSLLQALIVDEISMVSGELLDKLDVRNIHYTCNFLGPR